MKKRENVFDRTEWADCASCPLASAHRVWGGADVANIAKIALVGEAPGKDEAREGSPFVGAAGRLLQEKTSAVGYTWAKTWKTNVIACRPPGNKINTLEGVRARKSCAAGFQQELVFLAESGVRVFVALGNTPLGAFDVTDNSISKARGSVYPLDIAGHECFVVPTYHPAWLLRGNMRESSTWLTDLSRALRISREGWSWPRENFITHPTLADLEAFDEALTEDTLLAVDIETAGFTNDIIMIGFARDSENALCFPIKGHRVGSDKLTTYWNGEYMRASMYVKRWLAEHKCMFQNALYDIPKLRKNGFDVPRLEHDIMLLHHALYSELPHNLGYITSVYGQTPYWKDVRELSTIAAGKVPDEDFRTYNLRDCTVLHQVLPELLREATEEGVLWAYTRNMSLIPVVEHIQDNGLLLSEDLLQHYSERLTAEAIAQETALYALDIAKNFNFSSNFHVAYLFYGVKPKSYKKKRDVLSETERKGLRTDTKKYLEASAYVRAIDDTVPIALPARFKPPTTVGGGYAVDDDALDVMRRAIRNRLSAIVRMKSPPHNEAAEYERSFDIINTYSALQKTLKQLSNYTDFPTGPDGRVHGSYIIHGTATGRLASRSPNMQNLPKEAKSVFIAESGHMFIQADYSNLELRVLAVIAQDDVLAEVFARGENVHDANTIALFNVDKSHADWDTLRRAAKTYIFGRNYGGGIRGIYSRVSKQVPDLRLTLAQFKQADMEYRRKHPAYVAWRERVESEVLETRTLRNAFGRRRVFLGTASEIKREGLNFPIQSTAADVLSKALVDLHRELPTWCRIVATVHDSIVLEAPDEHVEDAIALLRHCMEQPFTINGQTVVFPVDIATGRNLGKLKDIT